MKFFGVFPCYSGSLLRLCTKLRKPYSNIYLVLLPERRNIPEKWLNLRAQPVGTGRSGSAGRKTFIVQALSRGIPPNIVMKWTGHSDYKAMKPYIDITGSIKASEMSKMNFLD